MFRYFCMSACMSLLSSFFICVQCIFYLDLPFVRVSTRSFRRDVFSYLFSYYVTSVKVSFARKFCSCLRIYFGR